MSTTDTDSVAVNPYAPPAAPTDQPRSRPTEGGGFRSATPLAKAVVAAMALFVLVKAAAIFNQVLMIGLMNRVLGDEQFEAAELGALRQRMLAIAFLVGALSVAAAVLFCFFMPRANRNARAFTAVPLQFSPGLSAGVFFVPVWNIWGPYEAMKEIWQASDPDPSRPLSSVAVPNLIGLWWLAFIVQNVFSWISAVARRQDERQRLHPAGSPAV